MINQQFQQRLILIKSRTIQVGNYKPYTIQANQSLLSYFGLLGRLYIIFIKDNLYVLKILKIDHICKNVHVVTLSKLCKCRLKALFLLKNDTDLIELPTCIAPLCAWL